MTPEEEKALLAAAQMGIKLSGEILSLRSEVEALKMMVGFLMTKQGFPAEAAQKVLEELSDEKTEKALLTIGEFSPELAEFIDIYKVLPRRRAKDDGKQDG